VAYLLPKKNLNFQQDQGKKKPRNWLSENKFKCVRTDRGRAKKKTKEAKKVTVPGSSITLKESGSQASLQ
jgi:hypothetical protein